MIRKTTAANGIKRTKNGLLLDTNQKQALVTAVHKMPSQILKLKAIPVYRTSTGNKLAKSDGKIVA